MKNFFVTNKKGVSIPKGMIGLFFEDINYGADSGLYAEMIENRNFEFVEAKGYKGCYHLENDCGYGWSAYPAASNEIILDYPVSKPLSEVNRHYLRVTGLASQAGFCNKAYDGIYLEKGKDYKISFYARSDSYTANIKISVEKDGFSYGAMIIDQPITGEWQQYHGILKANDTVRNALFVVTLTEKGVIDFDCISMIPSEAVLGLFRPDLVKWLMELKPGFLRFPGGCVVEGNTIANRYQWKDSIGNVRDRKVNWNRWAVHDNKEEKNFTGPYSHYNQTLGIGYFEYFLLCEYLGAKPLPVQNVGLACQYMSDEKVSAASDEFQEYIQDVLDLIEFANGDSSTRWGNVRALMGHEEPFGLEYIGIGNEQWETEDVDFFRRYEIFEKVIHEHYPGIKLISSAGPNVKTETYDRAWQWIREKAELNSNFTACVDEHYYMSPEWFYNNSDFYDSYPRNIKVFAGEYAAHVGYGANRPDWSSMDAALSEAAFMTGFERNADVIRFAAYAPLFAKLNYTQWSPDLIWFDDTTSYATPSYYVQKLYSKYMGSYTLKTMFSDKTDRIYETTSYMEDSNEIIIKFVNNSKDAECINVHIDLSYKVKSEGAEWILRANDLQETNSIDQPDKVAPVLNTLTAISNDFQYKLLPYAFQVLIVKVDT